MLSRIIAAFALLIAAPALATTGNDPLPGFWELKAGGVTVLRFELRHNADAWSGLWQRPSEWETDGFSFSKLIGPPVTVDGNGSAATNGDVTVNFANPDLGKKVDSIRFRLTDATHAKAIFGNGFSLPLTRASASGSVGPWPANHDYSLNVSRPTNSEMTAIYEADQAARKGAHIDWAVVSAQDDLRRARTQELLDSGALQSGDDFEHAAFVFQHGSKPEDYLKAHLLAMAAVARGKSGAIWIASATLDRYLVHIGQPQVLGTQYSMPQGAAVTQEPYDRTLISDQMREALKVPVLADQEIRRQQMQQDRDAAK